jgi:PAS domain S-box-containing protein
MNETREAPAPTAIMSDKALSTEQLLRYAQDLAEVNEAERARSKELEETNRRLAQEILERKSVQEKLAESEERYRDLFESSRDAIYITDSKGRFIDVNSAFLELFHYTRVEILGRSALGLVERSVAQEFLSELQMNGSAKDYEMRMRKNDGIIMDCLVTSTLRRAEDGMVLGSQGIVRDITEQKISQSLLSHARKMEALSNLAGGIAHEVRNPLAISSSAAQLLMDDDVPKTVRRNCAQKIVTGIQRASVIIENLLAFARPLADFEVTAVDLVALARCSKRMVADHAKDQMVEVVFKLPTEPVFVQGNQALLMQAIMNLYVNGLSAMQETGGTLITEVEKIGTDAVITITDTGRGIADQDLDKIFDPFFTNSPGGTGIGLGLSISYSIIQGHSGTIRVVSALGRGTTFTVTIPLAPEEVAACRNSA